jgi:hypothetical protein
VESEVATKHSYQLKFTGDIFEVLTAPIDAVTEAYWSRQTGKKLYKRAVMDDPSEVELPEGGESLVRLSDMPDVELLAGPQLKHGHLEVLDEAGQPVATFDFDDGDFEDVVDEIMELGNDNGLTIQSSSVSWIVTYEGEYTLDLQAEEPFDISNLSVGAYALGGMHEFIGIIFYDDEHLKFGGGTGGYDYQEVRLLRREADGSFKQIKSYNPPKGS